MTGSDPLKMPNSVLEAKMKAPNLPKMNLTALDLEVAVIDYFNMRANICVPNVSWGLHLHECDLIVLTKNGYAYEIEIKVSRADLIKDAAKAHAHENRKISRLYFAIPASLRNCIDYIPERAGILICDYGDGAYKHMVTCGREREAKKNHDYQWSMSERLALARLGTMRVWPLKRAVKNLGNELKYLREQMRGGNQR